MDSDRRDELDLRLRCVASGPLLMVKSGLHEADEQRMTAPGVRSEFRVELATEEPRVIGQFDHLDQIAGGRALGSRADEKSGCLDPRQVMVVDFVAVAMSLDDRGRAIDSMRKRPGNDFAGLCA